MSKTRVISEWDCSDWQDLQSQTLQTESGRGRVRLVNHPKGQLIERQYLHGGLRRWILPQWFLKSGRPEHEFQVHQRVFQAGLATVEPIGWRQQAGAWPLMRKYFYYTRFQAQACTLPAWLAEHPMDADLCHQMATSLTTLYRLGIFHTDLNLNNWLVVEGRLLLIDFDKASQRPRPAAPWLLAALRRMLRSARKLAIPIPQRAAFRLLLQLSHNLGTDPRKLLAQIPLHASRRRFYHPLLWKISGGFHKRE